MIIPYDSLDELKNLQQWINYVRIWNATKNGGRGGYDKPPINPATLRDGMTNRPDTWTDYNTAAANIGKTAIHKDAKHKDARDNAPTIRATVEGTGLVLAQGYCGVDLDGVINDGKLEPFAAEILDRLDTYAEISPSGKGLHLLLYCGDLLEAARLKERRVYGKERAAGIDDAEAQRRARGVGDFGRQFVLDAAGAITDEANKVYELEIYFYVHGGRYFTVTGKAYNNKAINRTKGAELRAIYDEYTARLDDYRAAQRPAPTVGTHYTTGRPATGKQDRQMIDSALKAIDPGALDFGEWASVMTALKVLGYQQIEAEEWSSGKLCGAPNPKNDPRTNIYRWPKFRFRRGSDGAAGIIINKAKLSGWSPGDAYSDEARAEYGRSLYSANDRAAYGRSLHTSEERRQYGRKLHGQPQSGTSIISMDGFRAWQRDRTDATDETGEDPHGTPPDHAQGRRSNGTAQDGKIPTGGTKAPQNAPQRPATARKEISLDDFQNWKNNRKKG